MLGTRLSSWRGAGVISTSPLLVAVGSPEPLDISNVERELCTYCTVACLCWGLFSTSGVGMDHNGEGS
jgi:hypothetical protein